MVASFHLEERFRAIKLV